MSSSPNILFITADQLGARDLGSYGSGVASTPTLDALATYGTRFTRCYANHPSCAPNRACLLTGRTRVAHGLVKNNYCLPPDVPTYAQLLKSNGYHTAAFGKLHQHPMFSPVPRQAEHLGFDEAVITEDPKWGPWIEWVREKSPEHYPTALAMCWDWDESLVHAADEEELRLYRKVRPAFLEKTRKEGHWPAMYASELPAELHDTAFITDQALAFLRRHQTSPASSPFFCHVSYVDPHDPYDPPAPYATMFRPEEMPSPIPKTWSDERFPALRNSQDFHDFHRIHEDRQAIAELRALFHGSLRFVDDHIGRLVSYLEENDLWKNTLVVFTSDHGEMLGDHGLITKGAKHYDRGIRCPLIVAGGGTTRGNITDRLTASVDFFPTFCQWAGIADEDLSPLEGKSFAPACEGEPHVQEHKELVVDMDGVTTLITNDGWRYSRYTHNGQSQLFHLASDPDELNDLSQEKTYAGTLMSLQARLIDNMTATHSLPQYRSMPVENGRRLWVNNFETRPGPWNQSKPLA